MAKKVRAGADFIQTQAVYDVPAFAQWMEQVRDMGLHEKTHILVGIIPIKSSGMARYMDSSVPGVTVPGEIMKRMKGLKGKKASREGIKIAIELIQQVREIEGVHGVHIMAIEWEDRVPEIVKGAGLLPRPTLS